VPKWLIQYSAGLEKAIDRSLRASDYARVVREVGALAENPGPPENARRQLREPVSWCPDATWRISISGRFRVLYRFDSQTVYVLCMAEKGNEALEEALVIFASRTRGDA